MYGMSGGFLGLFGRGKKAERAGSDLRETRAAEPAAEADDHAELHLCCICGAMLGFDLEDEIDGEGLGRDICGNCNRTKNFQSMMGWE